MTVHKRANNEGSVYWVEARKRWRGAVTLSAGKRRVVSDKTRKGAAHKLRALQAQVDAGLPTGDTDTVAGFLTWWLGIREAKAASGKESENTTDNAAWAVNSWIIPSLGTRKLRDLQPEEVESLLAEMATKGRSRRTVSRVRSYLGQALAVAQRRGKVSRNVARIAEMPETPEPVEKRSLTADEAAAFLVVARGDRMEALHLVALNLGLRPGELTGLRWDDLDLTEGTLAVNESMKHARGQLKLGDTKTRRSQRTLDLPGLVLAVLKSHRRRQAEERLAVGPGWNDAGLVFTTRIGTPIDPANLRRLVRRVAKLAGVPAVSPNELGRHTAASLLYDAGVPLEKIADTLGQTSTRMLEQTYRHRVRSSMSAHVAPMDQLFRDMKE